MSQENSVIVYAQRTPIGKMLGGLAQVPAPQMGAALVRSAVQHIQTQEVDEIMMGQVLTAGVGQAHQRNDR